MKLRGGDQALSLPRGALRGAGSVTHGSELLFSAGARQGFAHVQVGKERERKAEVQYSQLALLSCEAGFPSAAIYTYQALYLSLHFDLAWPSVSNSYFRARQKA